MIPSLHADYFECKYTYVLVNGRQLISGGGVKVRKGVSRKRELEGQRQREKALKGERERE